MQKITAAPRRVIALPIRLGEYNKISLLPSLHFIIFAARRLAEMLFLKDAMFFL